MPEIWLPTVLRLPDDQYLAGRLPRLPTPPQGIVIHSGERAPQVAEWITRHAYSYHVAWSHAHHALVQCVPLDYRAQHAGPAGNDWWGLALSGPVTQDPRTDHERTEWLRVMGVWRALTGGVPRYWCRHSDLAETKRDPGPGFTAEWADAAGLVWALP